MNEARAIMGLMTSVPVFLVYLGFVVYLVAFVVGAVKQIAKGAVPQISANDIWWLSAAVAVLSYTKVI